MPMEMRGDKTFYECILCSQQFQFGPNVYDGRHIPEWDVQLCNRCIRANWDGIVLDGRTRLKRHIAEKGIKITLNASGWLDIPPR